MEITLKVPNDILTLLREVNDPEGETWATDGDLTQADVLDLVEDVLQAWFMGRIKSRSAVLRCGKFTAGEPWKIFKTLLTIWGNRYILISKEDWR